MILMRYIVAIVRVGVRMIFEMVVFFSRDLKVIVPSIFNMNMRNELLRKSKRISEN